MEIYAYAREFMRSTGNPDQWGTTHPAQSDIEADISAGNSYVITDEESGKVCGTFFFRVGDAPTYARIENGKWSDDPRPYGVIHRIAGDGTRPGIVKEAAEYCFGICPHLRIDTHRDNKVMQHVLAKLGFLPRGTIYVSDGSPRIAYEKSV